MTGCRVHLAAKAKAVATTMAIAICTSMGECMYRRDELAGSGATRREQVGGDHAAPDPNDHFVLLARSWTINMPKATSTVRPATTNAGRCSALGRKNAASDGTNAASATRSQGSNFGTSRVPSR